jgi:anti-sigma factor RsiW
MTCEGYQEEVSQLVDNELGERESPALFAHLSTCNECKGFLHSTLRLRAGLHEDATLLAPNHLDKKVLSTTPARKRSEPDRAATRRILWKRRVSMPLPAAVLVMVLLMALIAATSSLWYPALHPQPETHAQMVYVTTFPTVEVDGYYRRSNTIIQ